MESFLLERLGEYIYEQPGKHIDIDYLTQEQISLIVSRGLTELFFANPKYPITFLAKWLLNECKANDFQKHLKNEDERKALLKKTYQQKQQKEEEKIIKFELEMKKVNDRKESLIKYINECEDLDDILNNICSQLQSLTEACGVYIANFSKKRKVISDADADEKSHLTNIDVLRYIAFSKDHSFLKNTNLEPNTGITYELFQMSKSEDANAEPVVNYLQTAGLEVKKAKDLKLTALLVPEVIRESKIKYFKEPRLGCYMAINISYQSSYYKESLDTAVENYKEFTTKLEDKKERDRLKELEKEEAARKEAEEADDPENAEKKEEAKPVAAAADKPQEEEVVEEKIELKDYKTFEKKFVLCLDTLGQDRVFDDEQQSYILKVSRAIVDAWEAKERNVLIRNRDLRLEMMNRDKIIKETFTNDKILDEEDKYVREYFESLKAEDYEHPRPLVDEEEKRIESEFAKTRFTLKFIHENEDLMFLFRNFQNLQFVEFEKVFQIILYFCGVSNTEINEEGTNRIDWKKAKIFWNDSILESLEIYNPFGPRGPPESKYMMIDKLLDQLTLFLKENAEALKEYSIILHLLSEFMKTLLVVRRDDIVKRKNFVQAKLDFRDKKIQEKKDQDKKREEELKFAKEGAAENGEEFILEEFDEIFYKDNAIIEIPDETPFDVDEDFYYYPKFIPD